MFLLRWQLNDRLQTWHRVSSGFTLLELMIVLAIIATLSVIAVPAFNDYIIKAQIASAIQDIKTIECRILLFETDNNRLPETLAEAQISLRDPWGNPYQYILIRDKPLTGKDKISPRKDKSLHPLNSDFDLWSMGPDGKSQLALTAAVSHDDIIRAGDGTFIGIAENY